MFSEDNYIMWFARIEGISIRKKDELLTYFGSAKEIFHAKKSNLESFCMKNRINYTNILNVRSEKIIQDYVNELYKKEIVYISRNNKEFPELLRNIQGVPLGIYVLGQLPDENLKKVAIVGARRCTEYGIQNAYNFAKEFAKNNIVVVSGMAIGIDSMAHKGAIDGGGKTISVLGCGVDIVYPPSNKNLRDSIIKNGCVISEFPPGSAAFPANFPIRNRIISGISDALVVVEAAKRSGTLITVGQALEQGRDIYAIPGNINNLLSKGTNDLIKECAYPLTEPNDVILNLGISLAPKDNIKLEKNLDLLEEEEKLVYDCISLAPISIDEIISELNLSTQRVQYLLTMLELKGYIQKLSGQRYIMIS